MSDTIIDAPEQRVYSAQIREVNTEGREFSGVAAPYGETIPVGSYLETLAPGVFKRSWQHAQSRKVNPGLPLMPMHRDGDWNIGVSVAWEETDDALIGTWRFNSRAEAREVEQLVVDGQISGLSVGFVPHRDEKTTDDEGMTHVVRQEARLLEVSLVPTPAYPSACITHVRTAFHPVKPRLDEAIAILNAIKERGY